MEVFYLRSRHVLHTQTAMKALYRSTQLGVVFRVLHNAGEKLRHKQRMGPSSRHPSVHSCRTMRAWAS